MSDDLVKRLRATTDGATVNPDGPEAADRIAELEAKLKKENESALVKQLREAGDLGVSYGWGRNTIYFRAADRIAELEAALRPFAGMADYCETDRDSESACVFVGDLRAARAALEGGES